MEVEPKDLTFRAFFTEMFEKEHRVFKPYQHSIQRDCKFLQLPAELRDEIYELVVIVPRGILILPEDPYSKRPRDTSALLGTCRQIRAEASKVYYSGNTFIVHGHLTELAMWLQCLGSAHRGMLRRVLFDRPMSNLRSEDALREFDEVHQSLARWVVPVSLPTNVLCMRVVGSGWVTLDKLKERRRLEEEK